MESEDNDTLSRLHALQDHFIDRWGQLASIWGTQRSGGRVHSLLYIAPEPLDAEAIGERLRISHGNTSTTLRQLVTAGVVRRMHRPGERRAYYESEHDPWQWMRNTIEQRRKREVVPVIDSLQTLLNELDALPTEDEPEVLQELAATREKVKVFMGFLEQLSVLLDAFIQTPMPTTPAPSAAGADQEHARRPGDPA